MEKKYTLTLDKEFILYCELNEIKDIDKLANDTFSRGFTLLKFGETPVGNVKIKEKIVCDIYQKNGKKYFKSKSS